MPNLPNWRSLLFVPANRPDFVEKAATRGADAIILDLEDSVPISEKAAARAALKMAVPAIRNGGADIVVRINQPLQFAVADIEAAIAAAADAIFVPKVDGASHVRLLDQLVASLESEPGRTGFILCIESLDGFFAMREIATASARTIALAMGADDFAVEAEMEASEETMLLPKQQLVLAARAAGVLPLGLIGSVTNFGDLIAYQALAERSRRFGFAGASCIHPKQVPILNRAFTPSGAEQDRARAVIVAFDDAVHVGRGTTSLDGKLIDRPVVERARRILVQAAQSVRPTSPAVSAKDRER
jgi:citrate lyase subunit beta/citryl-CoA lyase